MADLSSVYASALFDLAMEKDAPEDFMRQALVLRDALDDPESMGLLMHPQVSAAQKRDFFGNVLREHVHEDILGLLCLAIDKNREVYIIPALDEFIGRLERFWRKTTAKVISANELSDEHVLALSKALSKKLEKEVSIDVTVDPSIIGGLYIHVDGFLIDRTIKTNLRELRKHVSVNT
jgi:F-type H+-transporting ATPase subunit delta